MSHIGLSEKVETGTFLCVCVCVVSPVGPISCSCGCHFSCCPFVLGSSLRSSLPLPCLAPLCLSVVSSWSSSPPPWPSLLERRFLLVLLSMKASTGGGAQPPEARRMGGGGSMLAASTVLPLTRRARLSGSVGCGAQPPAPSSPDMLTVRFKAVLRMAESDREGQGGATTATFEPTRAPGTGSRALIGL